MDEMVGKIKSPLKALVVEDDVVSRMLLAEILKKSNIEVDFARNGKEAVDKVSEDSDSIDFILMDLKMPIMNGYEATLAIRELGFTKPIIAQTAYASQDDREKVLAGGFDAYLSKPVKKDVLLSLLEELW
ncbi:response regulator [Perlabentimonas gracilis]|uniref:response regulator n=1 Tax=Perlabentimonas gracilis TaxID=2715279 RepID=UPI00140ADD3B|nr:response regulator [Perlabentimonas gracilis]NHB69576.1 response regulator [Perlabentimonas gracilis]